MKKQMEESAATGGAAGRGRGGRFSARRKRETVLRLLRGADLESVSRELGVTAARASQWRDQFLVAGQAGLKSRATEAVDEDSGVGARMRAGLRASNRRARHLPMRYETGLPSSVIRFRT